MLDERKYLDDYQIGEKFVTFGRTITESDVTTFAGLTGDLNSVHIDAEYSKKGFGQRIAHGLLVLSVAHGLFYHLDLFKDAGVAFSSIENWQFKAPVFFGDTIHAEIVVEDIIFSKSKPDRGISKLRFNIYKQDRTLCQTGVKCIMNKRRPQN